MIDELKKHLNEPQLKAVLYTEGASLVIAGAGSGKTRVLTYKIAYLIEQGVLPHKILALTFTNKAAREMQERIQLLQGTPKSYGLWMGTFHSIFARILRQESHLLGYTSSFSIYDTSDSKSLIKSIIKDLKLNDKAYKPSLIHSIISRAKNQLISAQRYGQNKQLLEYDRRAQVPMAYEVYRIYENRLKMANAMDFDDLLFNTNRLFRDFPEVLDKYQQKFQFILVDEYQDTNFAQSLLVNQLANKHHRVCAVGDDAQSIYSFRGANIDNILSFKKIYPNAKIFKLEQNYRSTQCIVNAANSLIKKNTQQLHKEVFSKNEEGEKIELQTAFSDFEEGAIVANKIAQIHRNQHQPYSSFAILYRTNAQSRIFEEALRRRSIPYKIYGGTSFYQRKEVKDFIAYCRVIANNTDEESLKRIINFPKRGIGNTTISKISDTARVHHTSMWNILLHPLQFNLDVSSGTSQKLEKFAQLIQELHEQIESLPADEMALLILERSGLKEELFKDNTPESISQQENIQELINAIKEFTQTRYEEGDLPISLSHFLAEVSLLTDQDTDSSVAEQVTLMTVHASKGLEYRNVFIVGMEENLFPSSMSMDTPNGLEEERRLFYVAITRAQKFCMLSYAQYRMRNGEKKQCRPSRFLFEIDEKYFDNPLHNSTRTVHHSPFQNYVQKPIFVGSTKKETDEEQATNSPTLSNFYTQDGCHLLVGDTIVHERFGKGTIIALSGDKESQKATVRFVHAGEKQLLLRFAKIRKL